MTGAAIPPSLLQAAQQGDAAALERVLALAQPDIRRYARRTCATSQDVEDAVQDTLWVLYRKLGMVRTLGLLSAWLMAVVRHACLRVARRAARLRAAEQLDEADALGRLAHLPDEALRLDLARALESLPAHYRELVLLRDVEELTIDEIAQALGLTREAAKGRLRRARALMQEYLR
jgi:RNA polymerase sigma-70 factor (ECF subfamily)